MKLIKCSQVVMSLWSYTLDNYYALQAMPHKEIEIRLTKVALLKRNMTVWCLPEQNPKSENIQRCRNLLENVKVSTLILWHNYNASCPTQKMES